MSSVTKVYVPSPSMSCSQDRRQSGAQSPGQPISLWKLPAAVAIVALRLLVTQWVVPSK